MIAEIIPSRLSGRIRAIPSKSEAHRMLICAALSDHPAEIRMDFTSEDIEATIRCLCAFGAKIEREGEMLKIEPIRRSPLSCTADCGESGSTLRFLVPVAAALGIRTDFVMHGRLPGRPMTPLEDALRKGGCGIERPEKDVLRISGQLVSGDYMLPGNVSSQFITGMLLALPLLSGESRLTITEPIESADYIEITLKTMRDFGVSPVRTETGYTIGGNGRFSTQGTLTVGGDWSNAAFWLAAGVAVDGLDDRSAQGDRRIAGIIREFEATDGICTLDAGPVPDLVPAVAAYACVRGKTLRVVNAQRLRLKESDRIASVVGTIGKLGGDAVETQDGMCINGKGELRGGDVDAQGDHRIAMMAAILSTVSGSSVRVSNAEAVRKSYPEFWKDFSALGGRVNLRTEE